jgi:hypothetical protein
MPVTVKGAIELRRALRQFAPDLGKETTKEIAAVLKPLAQRARGFAPAKPLSGWVKSDKNQGRTAYDLQVVRRGIGYKTSPSKPNRQGFVALAEINNKSVAGAIYETAGRKSGLVGNFSPRLGGLVETPAGKGRLIYKAWQEDQGKATAAVLRAVETAAAKLNQKAK